MASHDAVLRRSAMRERLFPEIGAGGFSRVDGTVAFYTRVQAVSEHAGVVIDYGAGRGAWVEDEVPYRRRLHDLRVPGRVVVGIDVDPVVVDNPALDVAHVVAPHEPMPLIDCSADVIVADWVLEHITDPKFVAADLTRVLKPGGWLCARTPNRFGYVALMSRWVPNRLHTRVLARAQPHRHERDIFPTAYRMNTPSALATLFPDFERIVYRFHPEPAYAGAHEVAYRTMNRLQLLLPARFGATTFAFLRKPA